MRQLSEEKSWYPTIPKILYQFLEKQRQAEGSLVDWKVKDGEAVRKGDVIATFNVHEINDKGSEDKTAKLIASIKAPEDGILKVENFYEMSEWPSLTTLKGINIADEVFKNKDNLWFSIQRGTTYENRPTSKLLSDAYSDLIKYLFFMPSNPVDLSTRGRGYLEEVTCPENADDQNHDKIYLYLQAFADLEPLVMK